MDCLYLLHGVRMIGVLCVQLLLHSLVLYKSLRNVINGILTEFQGSVPSNTIRSRISDDLLCEAQPELLLLNGLERGRGVAVLVGKIVPQTCRYRAKTSLHHLFFGVLIQSKRVVHLVVCDPREV